MTAPDRFSAGAVDLAGIKARAEARAEAERKAAAPGADAAAPGAAGAGEGAVVIPTSLTVDEASVEAEVIRRSLQIPVVLLIGSAESPESEELRADLEQLAADAELGYVVRHVDAAAAPDIAAAFQVQAVPTVLILAQGRPITGFEGGQPRETLQRLLDDVAAQIAPQLEGPPAGAVAGGADSSAPAAEPEPADPRLEAAAEAMEAGRYGDAIAAYDGILASEPRNAEALQGRRVAALVQRVAENGADPAQMGTDPAGGESLAQAETAADVLVARGEAEAGFERLLRRLPDADVAERDRIRERLVELFGLFDPADPRVLQARARMASALF